ncbi:hypothetical protein ACRYCC_30150 [Actinomadura scrupuli]|uniref:hypothetical protein n=1 Tax=Actinomadura scrupuli TaxID=559629 RepID=UPI003D98F673
MAKIRLCFNSPYEVVDGVSVKQVEVMVERIVMTTENGEVVIDFPADLLWWADRESSPEPDEPEADEAGPREDTRDYWAAVRAARMVTPEPQTVFSHTTHEDIPVTGEFRRPVGEAE